MGIENDEYPGFEYPASELSAFALAVDTFVISLKNSRIICFCPGEFDSFKMWLTTNGARDISVDDGLPETFRN